MNDIEVICPYCNIQTELVRSVEIYGEGSDYGYFWKCPDCNAYVGTHSGSKKHAPLGTPANEELRGRRKSLHEKFDPAWKDGNLTRSEAYAILADGMNMPVNRCHIGYFTIEDCILATKVIKEKWGKNG